MVEMMMNEETSHWWWFDSHNTSSGSPWLQSTLAELDRKTKSMLKLIEADADSFAQRAEMYYKKRPELISMVEDFYRAHRSLAERYNQLKSDSGNRLLTTFGSPFSTKHRPEKIMSVETERTYDSHSETYDTEDSAESEVDDPEQDQIQVDEELEEIETPQEKEETHVEDSAESEVDDPEQDQIQVDEELEQMETPEEKEETHVEDSADSEVDDLEQDQIQVGEELKEIETPEEKKETLVDDGMKHFEVCTMYNVGDSADSEVDDLEQDQVLVGEELEEIETVHEEKKETLGDDGMKHVEVCTMYDAEVTKLKEEIERLEEEKRIYKDYLLQKDVEMREQKKEIKVNEGIREAEISVVVYTAEVMKLREETERLRQEKAISKDHSLQKLEEKTEEKKETEVNEGIKKVEFSRVFYDVEIMKLREEIEGLGEENRIYKEHLLQKDEEKREVIRQLSLAVDMLKLENVKLRKCLANQNRSHFTVEKLKDVFRGKLFNGSSKSSSVLVAI